MRILNKDALDVKRASAGLGLFARVEIPRGQKIIEYKGEKISNDEADRRGGKYLFTLSKNTVIDGKSRENRARYINHACKPNCYAEIDEDAGKVFYFAKRKIHPGEELSIHYGKEYFEDHIKPCGCKCPVCSPPAA